MTNFSNKKTNALNFARKFFEIKPQQSILRDKIVIGRDLINRKHFAILQSKFAELIIEIHRFFALLEK